MDNWKLGVIEERFADIIWKHEPRTSGELVRLCREELGWAKSTTYTVLRKLDSLPESVQKPICKMIEDIELDP